MALECERCRTALDDDRRWCPACERAYDTWSRQHATDVVWTVLSAGLVTSLIGMGLPLLGLDLVFAGVAIFAGFGTWGAVHSANRRRRRQQFLRGALPRAYLMSKT